MQAQESGQPGCETYLFDSFEVSVRQRVLRQSGERLKLQELPFQMLLILLETPGEIVSKEELGRRLWGHETFIEVDKSLYVMAGKLREALGDNAAQPRFIKTVSGRGYRFIGEVTPVLTSPLAPRLVLTMPASATRIPSRWRMTLWTSLALVAVGGGMGLLYRYNHRPLASDQDRIVIGSFTNSTGNADLDRTLSSAVQLKLQESPYLSLISDHKFRAALKDLDSASLKQELTACSSLDGQMLLKGRILSKGNGFQILLTAWGCGNGRLLTTQGAEAASQAAILPALDLATEHMRRRLGEPESSLQKFNVPLVQATTASLAALKAFTLGEEKRAEGDMDAAIAGYRLAVDLDPQFALAYARLGTINNNVGQYSLSRQYYQKAYELKNRASDREKLYIVTHYYEYATGETQRAIQDYELWRTLYPRDIVPTNNLAVDYLQLGEPQKALDLARRAIQLEPTNELLYGTLAESYLKLGQYSQVQALCSDSEHGRLNSLGFHRVCFRAAFALHDEAGMQKQMQWAHGNPQECEALDDAAWVAMYRGKISEAHKLFAAAARSAAENKTIESEADVRLDEARLNADVGDLPAATEEARQVLKLPFESASEQAYAALALARAGAIADAQSVAKKAAAMAPLDTIVNSGLLAVVRASVDLQNHNPKLALNSLEETRPLDFCVYMELAPAYYRGLAYLQAKDPGRAAKEFQSVIDHTSLADFPIYVVLSEVELGHTYTVLGDRAKAAGAYKVAEEIWKDADPGFPGLLRLHVYEGNAETLPKPRTQS
jgi:DNA-binding winged helix-turn-helix (wHTH) protein/tetratricopeptide (TPR) repeat protein